MMNSTKLEVSILSKFSFKALLLQAKATSAKSLPTTIIFPTLKLKRS